MQHSGRIGGRRQRGLGCARHETAVRRQTQTRRRRRRIDWNGVPRRRASSADCGRPGGCAPPARARPSRSICAITADGCLLSPWRAGPRASLRHRWPLAPLAGAPARRTGRSRPWAPASRSSICRRPSRPTPVPFLRPAGTSFKSPSPSRASRSSAIRSRSRLSGPGDEATRPWDRWDPWDSSDLPREQPAHLLFFNSTLAHGQLDLAADYRQAKVGAVAAIHEAAVG